VCVCVLTYLHPLLFATYATHLSITFPTYPAVNVIKFWNRPSPHHSLLCCNNKSIQFWKLSDSKTPSSAVVYDSASQDPHEGMASGERVPQTMPEQDLDFGTNVISRNKASFERGHLFSIHSLSINSDGESFLSADDLRINIWNVNRPKEQAYAILDSTPSAEENIADLVTCAKFHETDPNLLLYGSSLGSAYLCDMRQSALLHAGPGTIEFKSESAQDAYTVNDNDGYMDNACDFSEIVSSILDCNITLDGRHVITRDYMALRLWDTRFSAKPVAELEVHPHLVPHFPKLLENEAIFDQFLCSVSSSGRFYATGSYGDTFMIHDAATGHSSTILARDDTRRVDLVGQQSYDYPLHTTHNSHQHQQQQQQKGEKKGPTTPHNSYKATFEEEEFQCSTLKVAFHPRQESLAVAGLFKIFLYSPV
jgi:serine/threonine-protein phosphatase 2A regulatory subunit B